MLAVGTVNAGLLMGPKPPGSAVPPIPAGVVQGNAFSLLQQTHTVVQRFTGRLHSTAPFLLAGALPSGWFVPTAIGVVIGAVGVWGIISLVRGRHATLLPLAEQPLPTPAVAMAPAAAAVDDAAAWKERKDQIARFLEALEPLAACVELRPMPIAPLKDAVQAMLNNAGIDFVRIDTFLWRINAPLFDAVAPYHAHQTILQGLLWRCAQWNDLATFADLWDFACRGFVPSMRQELPIPTVALLPRPFLHHVVSRLAHTQEDLGVQREFDAGDGAALCQALEERFGLRVAAETREALRGRLTSSEYIAGRSRYTGANPPTLEYLRILPYRVTAAIREALRQDDPTIDLARFAEFFEALEYDIAHAVGDIETSVKEGWVTLDTWENARFDAASWRHGVRTHFHNVLSIAEMLRSGTVYQLPYLMPALCAFSPPQLPSLDLLKGPDGTASEIARLLEGTFRGTNPSDTPLESPISVEADRWTRLQTLCFSVGHRIREKIDLIEGDERILRWGHFFAGLEYIFREGILRTHRTPESLDAIAQAMTAALAETDPYHVGLILLMEWAFGLGAPYNISEAAARRAIQRPLVDFLSPWGVVSETNPFLDVPTDSIRAAGERERPLAGEVVAAVQRRLVEAGIESNDVSHWFPAIEARLPPDGEEAARDAMLDRLWTGAETADVSVLLQALHELGFPGGVRMARQALQLSDAPPAVVPSEAAAPIVLALELEDLPRTTPTVSETIQPPLEIDDVPDRNPYSSSDRSPWNRLMAFLWARLMTTHGIDVQKVGSTYEPVLWQFVIASSIAGFDRWPPTLIHALDAAIATGDPAAVLDLLSVELPQHGITPLQGLARLRELL